MLTFPCPDSLLAYFGSTLTKGGFDFASNNSLAPMIAIFTLAMIAVGLAAPER